MRLALCVLLVPLVLGPAALASRTGPETDSAPPVPSHRAQRREIARLLHRAKPVYCGGGRSNAVALTFDDGPSPYTERLLSVLRGAGAHATFFLVGNRLQYWPRAIREEAQLGALGNHTWSHPSLTDLPRWLVWLELERTQWEMARRAGSQPRLFRAPYERHDAMTDGVASSLGLLQVFWSVDSRDDAKKAKVARVVRRVLAGLRPGAIVLMHDLHPWTLRALPQILHAVRARGLRALSVPELLALDPPTRDQHCPYAPGVD
ncbi:MAG: polysaccharide deacetylase family protein [Actinomycetota bacterium]|nr:polysaccharide deacetylase family protein [Actinomycetota bacterium]